MQIVIIPPNPNSKGDTQELAAPQFNRRIKFRNGCRYAFVYNWYFYDVNRELETRLFRSEKAAAKFAKGRQHLGKILDCNGNVYQLN